MATETKTQASAPELTSLYRVASIPLVSSSLDTIHSTLSNSYLKSPYTTATGLAYSAWGYTEPLQVRLAPLTTRADGYANKGLDVVESRYPYPFKAKPEEITDYVRERRESVNKTIDERVKSPAYGVAQGIDQVTSHIHSTPYPRARAYRRLIIALRPYRRLFRGSGEQTQLRGGAFIAHIGREISVPAGIRAIPKPDRKPLRLLERASEATPGPKCPCVCLRYCTLPISY